MGRLAGSTGCCITWTAFRIFDEPAQLNILLETGNLQLETPLEPQCRVVFSRLFYGDVRGAQSKDLLFIR
jgi:hypothetical protein